MWMRFSVKLHLAFSFVGSLKPLSLMLLDSGSTTKPVYGGEGHKQVSS